MRLSMIGLRPPRRMVRMGVVKTDDVFTAAAPLALNADQIFGIDVVTIVRRISPRILNASGRSHNTCTIVFHAPKQNTAALVRVRLFAVAADGFVIFPFKFQHGENLNHRGHEVNTELHREFTQKSWIFSVTLCLRSESPHSSVQNLSLKYLSPESQRIVTITACSPFLSCNSRPIRKLPTIAAADEIPTSIPALRDMVRAIE